MIGSVCYHRRGVLHGVCHDSDSHLRFDTLDHFFDTYPVSPRRHLPRDMAPAWASLGLTVGK